MKKVMAVIGLMGLASVLPSFAQGAVGFSIFLSNAPPPPRVVFYHEPQFIMVPEDEVYVCDDPDVDYDVFRYGSFFYMYSDGYWYRSRNYGGPFMAIRIDYVPQPIFAVGGYGYRWREQARWPSGILVRSWDTGGRRFYVADHERRDWGRRDWDRDGERRDWDRRDWDRRDDRYLGDRLRRDARDDRRDEGNWRDTQPAPRPEWRDRRESRDQNDNNGDQGRGRGHGHGRGRGKDQGQDNGHGHGRGHDGDSGD